MAPLSLTGSRKTVRETPDARFIEVGAGENWHELIRWMLANSIYGMENLALIRLCRYCTDSEYRGIRYRI